MQSNEPKPVALTDDELELVVIALAELTIGRRRFAANVRRSDPAAADAAVAELVRAGVLSNRLSLEHVDRQSLPAAPAATVESIAALMRATECDDETDAELEA